MHITPVAMLKFLRNIFAIGRRDVLPEIPGNMRVYAIGDIHGRLDVFTALQSTIEADLRNTPEMSAKIIVLGDLIDRGPDSAAVLATVKSWITQRDVTILKGNHEEMFLRAFADQDILARFLKYGGKETLCSYGIPEDLLSCIELAEVQALMTQHISKSDITFIEGFADYAIIGDYMFVHAGVNPEHSCDAQNPRDLRWIRKPFLTHRQDFGKMIVHGHTISKDIEIKRNRIGIDTGAYLTGCLSALVLEGKSRRVIQAISDGNAKISIRCKGVNT